MVRPGPPREISLRGGTGGAGEREVVVKERLLFGNIACGCDDEE